MKKIFLILAAVSVGLLGQAQNYSGFWTGYVTQQSESAIASNYYFSLLLEVDGNQITGLSEIRLWDDATIMGVMELSGQFSEDSIALEETKIVKQQIYTFAYWCLKLLKMKYLIKDGKEILQGHWESNLCNGPGDIYLERAPVI